MKLSVFDASNKEVGKVDLPKQFNEPLRTDLIKKAVMVINANSRQAYGAAEEAGKRASAKLSRRRKKYRGGYGHGISRVPRKIMSRRGTQFNWVGAVAPGTVKGRRAHAPKPTKDWTRSINKKERRMAIRSAMAATVVSDLVAERGHKVPAAYPFVADNSFEKIAKTKDVKAALLALGLEDELSRVEERKIRAGRGKSRGRKYKSKVGPLLVVAEKCELLKAAKNIPGVEAVLVNKLNTNTLAPNATVGRLCIFTQNAIEKLSKESLFLNEKAVGAKE